LLSPQSINWINFPAGKDAEVENQTIFTAPKVDVGQK